MSDSYWRDRFIQAEDNMLDELPPEVVMDALREAQCRRRGWHSPWARRNLRRRFSIPGFGASLYGSPSSARSHPPPPPSPPPPPPPPPQDPHHRRSPSCHRPPVVPPAIPVDNNNAGLPHDFTWSSRNATSPWRHTVQPPRTPATSRFNQRHVPRTLPRPPCRRNHNVPPAYMPFRPLCHPFQTPRPTGRPIPPVSLAANTPQTCCPATVTAPVLPSRPPNQHIWTFPAGSLSWSPHPVPHPNIPASQFWQSNPLLGSVPRHCSSLSPDVWMPGRLTGGWSLPASQEQWTPGTWPPQQWGAAWPITLHPRLIPNPLKEQYALPQIFWDISQKPSTAKRLTGNHIVVDVAKLFKEQATMPAARTVHISCNVGVVGTNWGPIVVEKSSPVTIWDVMNGIYEYFNMPLRQADLDAICALGADNYKTIMDACYHRCLATPGLPGFEVTQGLRRVDCFGDTKYFWGMWLSFTAEGRWSLNLGLSPPRRSLL